WREAVDAGGGDAATRQLHERRCAGGAQADDDDAWVFHSRSAGRSARAACHSGTVAVALALAAATVFGAGDFLGGFATRRLSLLSVVVISQAVGLAGMLCLAAAVGGNPSGADLVAGAVAGLTGGAGVAMLYR